ncbi:MAG: META domain-containing protein [Pseudomonadota bacterium]
MIFANRIAALALALLLVAGVADRARATADGPDHWRVHGLGGDGLLELREAADSDAALILGIPGDTDGLANLGCIGGLSLAEWTVASEADRAEARLTRWCRIAWRGFEGWAPGRFLAEGSAPAAGAVRMRWRLVSGGATPAGAELQIFGDGAISGSTGCNRFNGTAEVIEGRLRLTGPLATTRMACPPPAGQTEARFLAVLEAAPEIAFDPIAGTLTLSGAGETLVFRP